MSNAVALIMGFIEQKYLTELVTLMPIWVEVTQANISAIEQVASTSAHGLTTFVRRELESSSALAGRIIDSLDQHFNDHSQLVPYNRIEVFGLALENFRHRADFESVGFVVFIKNDTGFYALKRTS
jgi:hypothetical protein